MRTKWTFQVILALVWVLSSLTGCEQKDHQASAGTGDKEEAKKLLATSADEASEARLHGTAPSKRLSAPEFTASNRDGSARTRADLLGHPTILWFYPKASTPG